MDDDWQSAGLDWGDSISEVPESAEAGSTLDELQRAQSELWAALRREEDPELRMVLLSRLSDNRSAILQLSRQREVPTGADAWFRPDDEPHTNGNGHSNGNGHHNGHTNGNGNGHTNGNGNGVADLAGPAGLTGPIGRRAFARWSAPAGPLPLSAGDGPPPPGPGSRTVSDGAPATHETIERLRAGLRRVGADQQPGQRTVVLGGALVSVLAVLWLVFAQPFSRTEQTTAGGDAAAASQTTTDHSDRVAEIQAVLAKMGLTTVEADLRPDGLHLVGTVPTEAQRTTVVAVVDTLAGGQMVVVNELIIQPAPTPQPTASDPATARAAALQNELNRLVAATPLIFDTGQAAVADLHARILNNVANVLKTYQDVPVRIVGYTDNVGKPDANNGLSIVRAQNVKGYLVGQGVPEGRLITEGRGQSASTGSQTLASLERRVNFEVVTPAAPAAAGKPLLKVALVAPSARNDLAFTQSMVDAIGAMATERGNVQVDVTDSTFVPADAAAAIKRYADAHYSLVIAHGVEFGADLLAIVRAHPEVTFAWGTATDTFGLPNLYAYDAASEQGGYVMGAMAAMLSAKSNVGVVGPIEVADASRYVNGFKAGALAQKPGINVPVTYTGSFSDIALAADAAKAQLAAGADVLTGSAEMVVGAVAAAKDANALWFGTQSNQAALAPNLVVASQVYHWEIVLRPIVADMDAGKPNGRSFVAQLNNGGLVIEYNPGYALAEPVRARADQLIADIKSGAVVPPAPK